MRDSSSILVIGGGVVGTACALQLARSGHDVTRLEPGNTPGVASLGNAGHIATEQIYPLAAPSTVRAGARYLLQRDAPLSIRLSYAPRILPWLMRFAWSARPSQYRRGIEALRALQDRALPALRDLLAGTDAGDLLIENGHYLISDRTSDKHLDAQLDIWRRDGVEHLAINPDTIPPRSPDCTASPARAWHFDRSAHITSPGKLLEGLCDAFHRAGGKTLSARAEKFARTPGGYRLSLDSGRTLDTERLVLAAGPDSARLLRATGLRVPLACEGGYHLHIEDWASPVSAPVVHAERKVILTPMGRGCRVSGFVELAGWKASPDPSKFEALERHFEALAPGAPIERAQRWYGFRPSLPDHLPVIGPVPDYPGLFCAFGHQHLGLTLSGLTALLIADLVDGKPARLDLAPFRPDRFGLKRLTSQSRDRAGIAR